MSLKQFHVLFISICVLLCLGFGAWCVRSDYAHGKTAYLVAGCGSFALAVVLAIYEILFLRKLRDNQ